MATIAKRSRPLWARGDQERGHSFEDVPEIFDHSAPSTHPPTPPGLIRAVLGLTLLTLGCSVETENFSSDEVGGSVHAVVRVQRVELLDAQDDASGDQGEALAAFVQIPPDAPVQEVLQLASLWVEHPEVGQCSATSQPADVDWEAHVRGELVPAERVELRTTQGVHQLAPHAFPSAYDLLHGMVFSSRDRSPRGLPADDGYMLLGEGIDVRAAAETVNMSTSLSSPDFPREVQISNRPFAEIASLSAQAVLDFSWRAEPTSTDLVVISITSPSANYRCAFLDAEGFGSVPLTTGAGRPVWEAGTKAQVGVHRIRETSESHPQLAQIKVSFDFSIQRTWMLFESN